MQSQRLICTLLSIMYFIPFIDTFIYAEESYALKKAIGEREHPFSLQITSGLYMNTPLIVFTAINFLLI